MRDKCFINIISPLHHPVNITICFNEKDSKSCQEQTTNKLTAVLGGISPFLLNKRKLRSGNSFTREHNGDITAENKATAFFYFFGDKICNCATAKNSFFESFFRKLNLC